MHKNTTKKYNTLKKDLKVLSKKLVKLNKEFENVKLNEDGHKIMICASQIDKLEEEILTVREKISSCEETSY